MAERISRQELDNKWGFDAYACCPGIFVGGVKRPGLYVTTLGQALVYAYDCSIRRRVWRLQ